MADDLTGLMAAGERAAFHGPPGAALGALQQAATLAQQEGRAAEATAATWLLGVSLAATGRYGGGLTLLEPLLAPLSTTTHSPELRLFAGLAAATVASVYRQLGRHAEARDYDARGLAVADGTAGLDAAAFDCRLGLAADAVGLGDAQTATAELDAAISATEKHADWWRQRVRADWVRAELALLGDDPGAAADAASEAIDRAELARAPRHVAKGLLFLGVAQAQAGATDAITTLRRAATLAEQLGTVPLVWPARAMLGALVSADDPTEGARCLQAARSAVLTIAGDLPAGLRDQWLARPDIEALLSV